MTLRAISAELHGLALRMHSLEAGSYTESERDAWFLESKALMTEANTLAQQAYASFPPVGASRAWRPSSDGCSETHARRGPSNSSSLAGLVPAPGLAGQPPLRVADLSA